ncbi:hypothetical protein [Paludisphaera sp.]|uniref:hypothetical protein n=1 Tax=Paludisphaera sp. TaxID=2017432 RepID=UPI00301BD41B
MLVTNWIAERCRQATGPWFDSRSARRARLSRERSRRGKVAAWAEPLEPRLVLSGTSSTLARFFDAGYYLMTNPDVASAVQAGAIGSSLEHFAQYGVNENRRPSQFFDAKYYLATNSDVAWAVQAGAIGSPFEHFVRFGVQEARKGGLVDRSTSVEASNNRLERLLADAPAMTASTYTRRPTLLILTQGAAQTGVGTASAGQTLYQWQEDLQEALHRDLTNAGSQVHTMFISWDSQAANTRQAESLAMRIQNWLGRRTNMWDVVFVGHSRGAIFNQEVIRLLGRPSKMRNLQHIMLDPTAAVSMGDQYPNVISDTVHNAVVYDDGYQFLPLGLVRDSLPINGAAYHRVTVPGVGYYDTFASHSRLPEWYADEEYKKDLRWLLDGKPVVTTPFVAEPLPAFSYITVRDPAGDFSDVLDIGIDIRDGNLRGSISVIGIGGADITIGKDGLDVGFGGTVLGSAGASISHKGITVSVQAGGIGPVNVGGGLILGVDESRLDVDLGPLRINLGTKGGGLYFGGKKVDFSEVASISPGDWTINTTKVDGVVSETYTDGVRKVREVWNSAGRKIQNEFLDGSGQWVSQRLDAAGKVVSQWIYFGGSGSRLKEWKAWAGDKLTDFEEYLSNGRKEFDRWLNGSGQWVSQRLDAAGKVVSQWIYFGGSGSQLYEWAAWNSSGVVTNLERFTRGGVRTLDAYISTAGNWVEKRFTNGVESSLRMWNSAGKYLGDQYKNWTDAAANLDPTTKGWWPF